MSANDNKREYSEEEKHLHHVLGGYKATLHNDNASKEAKEHAENMLEFLSQGTEKDVPENKNYSDEEKHLHHVLGGYKATLTNEKSSEEAKKIAKERLDSYTATAKTHYNSRLSKNEATDNHVIGGYRATLTNEKSSEEAKKHAREMLEKAGVNPDERPSEENKLSSNEATDSHVIGGYRATLTNEKSSEEAKKHAREMLEKAGVNPDERPSEENKLSSNEATDSHVIGGYRATLSNEKASDRAKKHAREMLEKAGVNPDERPSEENKLSSNEATDSHVIGGYRATLTNAKSSEEAKAHAREMLELAGVNPDERADPNANRENLSEEEKHRHHVEGGYKATLSNENASKEAKEHAQAMLDKLAKGEELPESENAEKRGTKRSQDEVDADESNKGKQGFASMPKEKVQEIASLGGRTVHAGEEPVAKKAAK